MVAVARHVLSATTANSPSSGLGSSFAAAVKPDFASAQGRAWRLAFDLGANSACQSGAAAADRNLLLLA